MNRIITSLVLLPIICLSCGTNDNSKQSDSADELFELLENISKKGEGPFKVDSTTGKRILDLVDNLSGKWNEIKSKEGNFRIEFPDFEVEDGQTTQISDGEEFIIYHYAMNTQNEDHDNLGYRVDYTFLPDIKTQEQIDQQFSEQRDYVMSAANAILEYEYVIDTMSYPGREMLFTIDGSKIKTRYRLFFDNGIFYKLMVVTADGKHFNKSLTRFLNSFKTLDE